MAKRKITQTKKSTSQYLFNPLADYKKQIIAKPKSTIHKIGKTSLRDDMILDIPKIGFGNETEFTVYSESSNNKHTKVYHTAINRNLLLALSPSGLQLFTWLLFSINYANDIIEISFAKAKETNLGIGETAFRQAIIELELNQIILRSQAKPGQEGYWLFFFNPQIIWAGDSVKYFRAVVDAHPEFLEQSQSPSIKSQDDYLSDI